jgi:Mg-chelatase subunit ChlD
MDLTTDTARRDLALLSRTDRTSEQRRSELQRLANVLTSPGLQVSVNLQDATAFARPASTEELHDFEINIPVKQFRQVETDLPDHQWARRVQMALLFHELGHIFYSDFERFQQRSQEVKPIYRELFRTIYNAAEDIVIEAQLAAEYALEDDFATLNDTFKKLQRQDQRRYVELFSEGGGETFSYTIFEALELGILSEGFGSVSRFSDILAESEAAHRIHNGRHDILAELTPALRKFVAEMLTTRDGTERVENAFEFFTDIRPTLADLPTIQTVRVQTESFRPVEAGNGPIRPPDPATNLPTDRPAREQSAAETGPTSAAGSREDHPDVDTLLGSNDPDGGNSLRQEAEQLLDIVQSDQTDVTEVGVMQRDEGDGDPHRWEQARKQAHQLTADLRSSLRRRRRSKLQSGHRTGQIDPHRVVQAVQGRDRVFQRREPGDDRDYACLIVLDRSGSMAGTSIEAAERATAQLIRALTTVGVDTSVLSLWRNRPCLELPFGGTPRRFVDHLTSARVGGGTPLSDAIAIARRRIVTGAGNQPFVIVITDGHPDDTDQYIDELDRCTFDIYGVYIDGTPGSDARYFDRLVYTDGESVAMTMRALAREMFK